MKGYARKEQTRQEEEMGEIAQYKRSTNDGFKNQAKTMAKTRVRKCVLKRFVREGVARVWLSRSFVVVENALNSIL